jgi:hypothetical protein
MNNLREEHGIENRGRSELEYGKKEPFCLLFLKKN